MTQFAETLVDHAQSRVVSTVNDPVPPFSEKLVVDALTCTWHFTMLGAASVVAV